MAVVYIYRLPKPWEPPWWEEALPRLPLVSGWKRAGGTGSSDEQERTAQQSTQGGTKPISVGQSSHQADSATEGWRLSPRRAQQQCPRRGDRSSGNRRRQDHPYQSGGEMTQPGETIAASSPPAAPAGVQGQRPVPGYFSAVA